MADLLGKDEEEGAVELLRAMLVEATAQAGGCAIIYVHKRKTADSMSKALSAPGLCVRAYHAKAKDRGDVLSQWQKGKVDVVVATIAFGMGIDRASVRLVVHLNIPRTVEGFYQESGRAGRDGAPAKSVLLYSLADKSLMDFLLSKDIQKEKRRKGKGNPAPASSEPGAKPTQAQLAHESFGKMVEYAVGTSCRRAFLLKHFGESLPPGDCIAKSEACDACTQQKAVQEDVKDLREEEQARRGDRFGGMRRNGRGEERPTLTGAYGQVVAGGSDSSGSDGERDSDGGGSDEAGGGGGETSSAAQQAAASALAASKGRVDDTFFSRMEKMERLHELKERGGKEVDVLRQLGAKRGRGTASSTTQQPVTSGASEEIREKGKERILKTLGSSACGWGLSSDRLVGLASALEAPLSKGGMAKRQIYLSSLANLTRKCSGASSVYELVDEAVDPKDAKETLIAELEALRSGVQYIISPPPESESAQAQGADEQQHCASRAATSAPSTNSAEGGGVQEGAAGTGMKSTTAVLDSYTPKEESMASRIQALLKVKVSMALLGESGAGKKLSALRKLAGAPPSILAATRAVEEGWKEQLLKK
eukprot:gene15709-21819_t